MDNTTDTPQTPDEFETLIQPEAQLPEITPEELPESLRAAMARAGWEKLMPVQSKSLPYLLQGQDLMVQSRTGSGKTGAFLMPIYHLLDQNLAQTQALILCPTRELAKQVAMDAEMLFGDTELKVATVYGGVGYGPQTDALRAGAHLVVGTPGRILDHLLRRNLTLDGMRVLVFDEADRMLSIGFYPDMKEIKRYLPKRRVSTFLFSATYPPHVLRLAEEFMDHPNFLSLSAKQVHVADILHQYIEVPGLDKDRTLVRLIEIENPSSAIIFSNTKANVHYIAEVLKGFGYDAEELSADLSQAMREHVLLRLRKRTLRFLVATDVAARGIDIPELSHVFQYEPPEDPESYVHRAGRTGRAGASGTAITLVNIMEELAMKRIGQRFGIDLLKRPVPTDEEVSAVVSERLTALLEAELRAVPALKKVRLQRFLPLAQELAASEDASLLAMLLDERYQSSLHAIPETPEGAPLETRRERPRDRDRDRDRDRRDRERDRDRDRRDRPRSEARPETRAEDRPRAQVQEDPAPAQDRLQDPEPNAAADQGEGEAPRRKSRRRSRGGRKRSGGEGSAPESVGAPGQDSAPSGGAQAAEAELAPFTAESLFPDDPFFQSAPLSEQAPPEVRTDGEGEAPEGQEPQGEVKKKRRRRRRSRKKPAEGQEAQGGQEEAPEDFDDEPGNEPEAQAADAVGEAPAQEAGAEAKPSRSRRGRGRGTRSEPREEAQPQEPRRISKAEAREGAPTKKTVEIEYKPDEYKGIEWD
ncbi:ATP-dependent RNA helicase CshA [Fundidesulfovibrio magnetotacticus]|uniref:ATP-dependent RNA helicase CshA n=1 Tax=Fundidesulfovibrio magnetotacticus TaxID=2730080 RepID=A0A6V8LUI4_9BACT|nr:DEAD/DEAH box helicase [Fundidesulfovibrio magnetotacticus]GFK96063.1 ATP-dependent RNA helicase CshA [Fundidesulfovibrio magnetotacticus]